MRIQFNEDGFRELLTGAVSQGILDEHTAIVAGKANATPSTTDPPHDQPYYRVEEASDADRARRRILPDGVRAMAHEAKTHALLRAIT